MEDLFICRSTREELRKILSEELDQKLQAFVDQLPKDGFEYWNIKRTCDELHISQGTLNTLTKQGFFERYHIGRQPVYIKSEIEEAIRKTGSLKYNRNRVGEQSVHESSSRKSKLLPGGSLGKKIVPSSGKPLTRLFFN